MRKLTITALMSLLTMAPVVPGCSTPADEDLRSGQDELNGSVGEAVDAPSADSKALFDLIVGAYWNADVKDFREIARDGGAPQVAIAKRALGLERGGERVDRPLAEGERIFDWQLGTAMSSFNLATRKLGALMTARKIDGIINIERKTDESVDMLFVTFSSTTGSARLVARGTARSGGGMRWTAVDRELPK